MGKLDPLSIAGGVPATDSSALPGDGGYQLHAAEVAFRHPHDGREVVVTAEPPAALRCVTSWCDPLAEVRLDPS